ncbi:MAG: argininosuccinate lyase [Oscillospiraceae bacterium]|jgi:argininosuccinate lyase
MANLWAGRFSKKMESIVEEFNASIGVDSRLYACDIKGSIAHVTMLAAQGIVTQQERDEIIAGLQEIEGEIARGEFTFDLSQEDIHMAVEGALIQRLGETGKKLHTARSRNDQVAVDTRLYMKEAIGEMIGCLRRLQEVLLEQASRHTHTLMVGFTHMQHAQPVTVGFHLMAYFQMFLRDIQRLQDVYKRTDLNPLGSCALAGTTLPIDRHLTTRLLGFAAPTENAMDSVSDRDYLLEFLSAASIGMMHISRMAEEFVYWSSQEFGYISLDDGFCTGSSIMPQKKNPDVAELLRGKTGRVYGDLIALLTVMKGTPMAYNKDFQEDKERVFDALDTWRTSVEILTGMLEKTDFNTDTIAAHMDKGFLAATDLAECLVKAQIPFREAHEMVGRLVRACEEHHCRLEDLPQEVLDQVDSRVTREMVSSLTMKGCVEARTSFGGTAPSEVERQIAAGRQWLEQLAEQ